MAAPILPLAFGGEISITHHDYTLVALAVVATFLVIAFLLGLYSLVKRRPPIESEIDAKVKAASDELRQEMRSIQEQSDCSIRDLRDEMLRLNHERRVTVAGLFQKLEDYRKETKDDLGQLSQSIQLSFRDISHAIGRLEGQSGGTKS